MRPQVDRAHGAALAYPGPPMEQNAMRHHRSAAAIPARALALCVALAGAAVPLSGSNAQGLPWTYLGARDAAEPATPPPQGVGTRFGDSVDADGGWIAVGAPFRDLQLGQVTLADVGAVYLYRRAADGAVPATANQVIRSAALESGARFGSAVAIDGTTLMVGAPGHGPNTEGRVEFWRLDPKAGTWAFVNAFDGGVSQTERLGQAVALDGLRAAAGAPGHQPNTALAASGRVQLFTRNAAGEPFAAAQSLLPPSPVLSGAFGTALAILDQPAIAVSPDRLVVGEPGGGAGSPPKGLVWIYEPSGGNFAFSRLIAPGAGETGFYFGIAVATSSGRVLVGGLDAVRVLVEERSAAGWSVRPPIDAPIAGDAAGFGRALDFEPPRLIVGRPLPGSVASRAFVYELLGDGTFALRTTLGQPGGLAAPWPSFGRPLAIDGRLALVAAPEDEVGGAVEGGRVALFADNDVFGDGFEPSLD